MADTTSLLSLCDPVHLVLLKTEPTGETTIVSSHYMEWRPVIAAPNSRCTMTVELMGLGMYAKNAIVNTLIVIKLICPKL